MQNLGPPISSQDLKKKKCRNLMGAKFLTMFQITDHLNLMRSWSTSMNSNELETVQILKVQN